MSSRRIRSVQPRGPIQPRQAPPAAATQPAGQVPEPVGPIERSTEVPVDLTEAFKPAEPANLASPADEAAEKKGWIGIDLDGTLAKFDRWQGLDHIGAPIPAMVLRVQSWIEQGYTVKIVTARASVEGGIPPVLEWLRKYQLPPLEVTCQKDFQMIELWDDRAVQIVPNKGAPVLSARYDAHPRAPLFGIEKKRDQAQQLQEKYDAVEWSEGTKKDQASQPE